MRVAISLHYDSGFGWGGGGHLESDHPLVKIRNHRLRHVMSRPCHILTAPRPIQSADILLSLITSLHRIVELLQSNMKAFCNTILPRA